MNYRWGLALLLLLSGGAQAATVHSLDQVPAQITTPEGKAHFAQQIAGDPAPDLLGAQHLPPGLSSQAIAGLLVPASDHAAPSLVGARAWHDGLYVAIVYAGGAPQCSYPDAPAKMGVYLGVIALTPGDAPRLVAASETWDARMGWGDTRLPRSPQDADGDTPILPQDFTGFDLADYAIAPGERAFGLRGQWQESYSGGGASFTGLYLFTIDGATLRPVFAAPMSAFSDIAGDWHKDGTRDHEITDAANLLVVTRHPTAGHFDLELRQKGGHGRQVFRWAASRNAYRP